MRDLLRLLVVAALSFAVVGIAMVYSRGGDLPGVLNTVALGASGLAADVGQMLDPETTTEQPVDAGFPITLRRPHGSQWVGLAGFPDQAEIAFPLPRDGQFRSGALELVFDTQLAEDGDGLLTIGVNGTPRGQVVMDDGRATHSVRIALDAADLAGDRVTLSLAGRGTTSAGQVCPTDAINSGSAVTLSPDSRLELVAEQPLADPIQAMVIAPRPLAISGDPAMAIWAAQELNRAGVEARLGAAGATDTAVEVSDRATTAAGVATANVLIGADAVDQLMLAAGDGALTPDGWPVGIAELGGDTVIKNFRGSRRWTVPFTVADLPGGALPDLVHLALKTTPLAGSADWMVRVSLNGNFLSARRLAGSSDSIAFDVPLPETRLLPRNQLTVELVDTSPGQGVCDRTPDAVAQLLPESELRDTGPTSDGWASLVAGLASASEIGIAAAEGLSPAQMNQASDVLGLLLPRRAPVTFDGDAAVGLTVIDRAGLAQALAELDGEPVSAVLAVATPAGTALTVLPVPSADFGAALDRLGADDVVVLATGL